MTCLVYLHKPAVICALGDTTDAVAECLFADRPKPLSVSDEYTPGTALPLGRIALNLPSLGAGQAADDSRNNRLLMKAMEQLTETLTELRRSIPAHRIGVVLGTSTSGIAEGEAAVAAHAASGELPEYYHYRQQEIGAPAQFLARHLRLAGPAVTISTACSSSAKALASARRMLDADVCDAVICGGVDTLCRLTVNGFSALDSISAKVCNPLSANRDGINIGEAASLFIMTRTTGPVALSGCGETSDAHHFSAPHPEGTGARKAIEMALQDAGVSASQIGYINLHGTATPQNDRMESLAVHQVFGGDVPCSSTKPLTGHTLGAAGALEAAFCWLTLVGEGKLPPHWWDQAQDEQVARLNLVSVLDHPGHSPEHVLSNSFAFGGNNIALILSKTYSQQG